MVRFFSLCPWNYFLSHTRVIKSVFPRMNTGKHNEVSVVTLTTDHRTKETRQPTYRGIKRGTIRTDQNNRLYHISVFPPTSLSSIPCWTIYPDCLGSSLPCLTLYPELWGLNSDREKLRLQREKGERTPIGKSLLLECKSGTPMAGLASGLTQMVNEVIEGGVAPRKVSAWPSYLRKAQSTFWNSLTCKIHRHLRQLRHVRFANIVRCWKIKGPFIPYLPSNKKRPVICPRRVV